MANTITWDYLPLGINACQGRALSEEESLYARGGNSSTYVKGQFQAHDATFSNQLVSMCNIVSAQLFPADSARGAHPAALQSFSCAAVCNMQARPADEEHLGNMVRTCVS